MRLTLLLSLVFVPNISQCLSVPAIFSSVASKSSPDSDIKFSVPQTIAVTGATGRTGSLVVQELLGRGNNVIAMVRDLEKAKDTFPSNDEILSTLKVVKCNLGSEPDIIDTIKQNKCDAVIWCATGFSDNPQQTIIEKLQGLLGVAVTPKKSIDAVGIPAISKAFEGTEDSEKPKIIMLSSAGVTRPSWDEGKKEMFKGCADIPIVRLNPFGILDIKADSEESLRKSGVSYCIFRPTGLNDNWPSGARPIFSQGDVAVGRINRKDVARILVDCVDSPQAAGKTFEAFSVQGYPPAPSVSDALERLRLDSEGPMSLETLTATFSSMQQLLPGEKQDAAALAMGQTYEELDADKTGRLGKRGEENAEAAAPKPTST